MNDEKIRLPGLDDDENATLNRLLAQLDQKAKRNLLRSCYYDGRRALQQVGTVIPPQYYKIGLVLGWSAKAVDILARRCNLDGFVWPDGDLDALGWQAVWDQNLFGAESSSAMISSLLHGVAFLVNTEGDTSIGEPKSLIHVKDALSATGEWNGRTRRLNNLLSITSRDDQGKPIGLALYLDGVTITAERSGRSWDVDRSEHPWGVPAEALVYRPRAGRPLGYSRISRAVMSLHDQALRTVIRLEGHSDVFSYPEMWLLGADESAFKNADGTQKAVWQVMLGRIKGLPDDEDAVNPRADVKQFAAASPQPHLDTLKQQAQLFSGETSIPLTSLGVSDMSNPTSADSYIASREDLIAEAEGATDDWAPAMRRSMARALAIAQGEKEIPLEWASIDAKWRSPIHLSRAAQADAGMKQLAAVSWLAETEVGLELLGLDEQQIKRAMSEKRRLSGSGVLQRLSEAAAATSARPAPVPATTPVADGLAEPEAVQA
ncbi:phage portal protein [Nocardia wallacei]|uniref:phage portal protein n=1 Tax=Nocardia wallacei TaxID=480035 RepID=UPI0024566194|nr:phage portal protein [Nocardia wallacei]